MSTTLLTRAALAVTAALLLTSCSSLGETEAASVNGESISAEDLEDELVTIRSNERYRESVEQGLAAQGLEMTVSGDGDGTFDSAFVARLLSLNVYYQLLEQEMSERGLELSADELDTVRPQVVNSVGGDVVFDAFPASYQDELVRRQAISLALQGEVGAEFGPERAQELYEQDPSAYTSVCVSHIFASKQERGPDEARARIEDLARQLAEGADFRTLATEQSDDPAAAAQAGSLGCGGRGRFLPEFEEAAFEVPVGQVSAPVESTVGYHLILVEDRRSLPFEDARPQVEQALQQRQLQAFSDFMDEATCEADIDVNPRYGDWFDGCDDPGVVGVVEPPEGPLGSSPAVPLEGVPGAPPPNG